jgi:hypothetical protein
MQLIVQQTFWTPHVLSNALLPFRAVLLGPVRYLTPFGVFYSAVNGARSFMLPVVATCAAVAMLTQLLKRQLVDKTKLLEPQLATPEPQMALPDPQITVFRLRVSSFSYHFALLSSIL